MNLTQPFLDDDSFLAALENPPHLAKLTCGHIVRFVLSPRISWEEWCPLCRDFAVVVDGV